MWTDYNQRVSPQCETPAFPSGRDTFASGNRPKRRRQPKGQGLRFIDILLSLTIFVFLLPAVLTVVALLYLFEGGKVFYSQDRLGFEGRRFQCYKFRSMKPNSDHIFNAYLNSNPDEFERYRVYRKVSYDPRVTPLGRLLRKTSFDEIPQLMNVTLGSMSIVGPRPILPDEREAYGPRFTFYQTVRPGITGLWQVRGRNRLSFKRRVLLDSVFVKKYDAWLYFRILLATFPAVFLQKGAQ